MSYDQLPRRQVVTSPYPKKEIISHGIIAISQDTNRYAMIQPHYTTAIKYFVYGAYRPVHITDLLDGMTLTEVEIVQKIAQNKDSNDFANLYLSVTGNHAKKDSWYGYYRLIDLREDIISYKAIDNLPEPPYSFPKGKARPKEDSIVAANREFTEEMGIELAGCIIPKPIDYFETGLAGRNYQMRCWKCLFPTQIDLSVPNRSENREINHRAWIDVSKANQADRYPIVITEDQKEVHITSELLNFIHQIA